MVNSDFLNEHKIDPTDISAAPNQDDSSSDAFDMGDENIEIPFEELVDELSDDPLTKVKDSIQERYEEARLACKDMVERISYDMAQTNYNPYIRTTTTRKIEILRKSTDTEPIDVFEFEKTSGFSLRAIAISAAVVVAADIAAAILIKKKFF